MPIISGRQQCAVYVFGAVELRGDGTLAFGCESCHLPPKELEVLRLLLDSPGVVVSKTALLDAVWRGGDIGEESLTRCIYTLRKLLGVHKHYIATVYGKGYRLTCPVRRLSRVSGGTGRLLGQVQASRVYASVSPPLAGSTVPARLSAVHPTFNLTLRPSVRVFGLASARRLSSSVIWQ